VLLIYPEGARTRSGRMQPFLRAVYRYFKVPGTRIVPAALVGTAEVMPVGENRARPESCSLAFGPALDVEACGGPRAALATAHSAISELLPHELRPKPGEAATG
jgi:1-acyl-sn-glycerol-3-phosphate acyltransferase